MFCWSSLKITVFSLEEGRLDHLEEIIVHVQVDGDD